MTSLSASTPALLTREQVGRRLDLTPQSVDGLVRSGELSPVPPFTGPTERRVPAYIAFADRDHLVTYLRQRAEAELD